MAAFAEWMLHRYKLSHGFFIKDTVQFIEFIKLVIGVQFVPVHFLVVLGYEFVGQIDNEIVISYHKELERGLVEKVALVLSFIIKVFFFEFSFDSFCIVKLKY